MNPKKLVDRFIKPTLYFESRPPFSDNTRMVYDELMARGYGRKYRMVWNYDKSLVAYLKKGKEIIWNPRDRKGIIGKIRNYSFYYKRKANIICNLFVPKAANEPTFYLKHGSPFKSVKGYYPIPDDVDYIFSQAKAFEEICAKTNDEDITKMVSLGFPRNDAFSRPPKDLKEFFDAEYKKLIVWYPTYRQKEGGFKTGSSHAIPLIYDEASANKLNQAAKEYGVLIVIKPHFAQDVSVIRKLQLTNLVFIDDTFFTRNHITSYEFLNGCDALITDYSSVYYDYTLADKPIGVIWEDIEEYLRFPGFAVDPDYWMKGAEKLYTIDDLNEFIHNVSEGKDKLQKERREIRDVANYSIDGNNTKRVVDFIIEKADL